MKRIVSAFLCVAMLLLLLPMISQTVSAAAISDLNIRLSEPIASYTPDTSPEFSVSGITNWTVTWKENSPGFSATVGSSDEFRPGLAYKVEIWMLAGDGNPFATDIYHELAANITVNGKAATAVEVVGRNGQGLVNQLKVTQEYGPLSGMVIKSAMVTGIPTPLEGNMPIYSFTISANAYNFYHTAPVVWWDMTTGKEISSGDTFIKGHKYQVEIWLQANREKGYTFQVDSSDNPVVNVTLNSWAPDSVKKAYEQDPREVIAIHYTFAPCQAAHTCAPTLVPQQDPTCLLSGFKAYYTCSCGKNFEDAAGKKEITDMDGYGILSAYGHTEGSWSYNGTHHYKKCTRCKEVIPGTNAAHSGGTATCLKKANCKVCGQAYGNVDAEHRWGPGWDYKDAKGHAWVCADCKTHDAVKPHVPGPTGTEGAAEVCRDCGYIITPAKNHTHKLSKVAEVPATCVQEGTIEYYACSGCSDRFKDAAGKNKITDSTQLRIGALGHETGDDWAFDGEYHWRTCKVCKVVLEETKHLHEAVDGKCSTCGYSIGTEVPEQTEETKPAETEDTEPKPTGEDTGIQPDGQQPVEKKNDWALVVMIALVCFGAAVLVTVIILKKKKPHGPTEGE